MFNMFKSQQGLTAVQEISLSGRIKPFVFSYTLDATDAICKQDKMG